MRPSLTLGGTVPFAPKKDALGASQGSRACGAKSIPDIDIETALRLKEAREGKSAFDPGTKLPRRPRVCLLGEMPFADIATIGKIFSTLGLQLGAHLPCTLQNEIKRAANAGVVVAARPGNLRTAHELRQSGQPLVDSAPIGAEGTHNWIDQVGKKMGLANAKIVSAQNTFVARIWGRISQAPLDARVTVSGTTGNELQIARLLLECGADVPIASTAHAEPPWRSVDAEWLRAHGTRVEFRTSARAARDFVSEFLPHLAIGPTTICARARSLGLATLNADMLRNLPLMGPTGAAPLARLAAAAIARGPLTARRLYAVGAGPSVKS